MEPASQHASYISRPVFNATSQKNRITSRKSAGSPRSQTRKTTQKLNQRQSSWTELSKTFGKGARGCRPDQSVATSESSGCHSVKRHCYDTPPSSTGEDTHAMEIFPQRHEPGGNCDQAQLQTQLLATNSSPPDLCFERHQDDSNDVELAYSSTSLKSPICLQGRSNETASSLNTGSSQLRPEESAWAPTSAVEVFETHPGHDYWTWDIKSQRWFHRYEETGLIIYCPNSLD
ncbi:hypothetical protein LZ30DRAFT_766273 [Colletotrichum cereale]|nr:hypothetical protein LZ30DRAFT_766273 [Colletotrichum cereale]